MSIDALRARSAAVAALRWLLPVLIPSWRFFDRVGPAPSVEFALGPAQEGPWERWEPVHPRPRRLPLIAMFRRLFWNPAWNEALYLVSCAERLLEEPTPARATRLWMRVADAVGTVGHPSPDPWLRVRIVETMREHERIGRDVRYVSNARPLRDARAAGAANARPDVES